MFSDEMIPLKTKLSTNFTRFDHLWQIFQGLYERSLPPTTLRFLLLPEVICEVPCGT